MFSVPPFVHFPKCPGEVFEGTLLNFPALCNSSGRSLEVGSGEAWLSVASSASEDRLSGFSNVPLNI